MMITYISHNLWGIEGKYDINDSIVVKRGIKVLTCSWM